MQTTNYRFIKVLALGSVIAIFCFFKPQQAASVKSVTPSAYQKQVKKGDLLVDVRTQEEFQAGHVQEALNSNFNSGKFAEQLKSWDKNKTYYLYCASGNRSGKAAQLMHEAGFKHVYNLGAFKTLKEAGLPTSKKK